VDVKDLQFCNCFSSLCEV